MIVILVTGLFFHINKHLNNLIKNFDQYAQTNHLIFHYDQYSIKLYIIKNKIIFSNIELKIINDKYNKEPINSLKASNLELSFSFLDIFRGFNIKNITLNNPDFNIYSKKYNFDDCSNIFNKENNFYIKINQGKINYINKDNMHSKKIHAIDGLINFNGNKLDSNISFVAGDIPYNLVAMITPKKNEYSINLKISNTQSIITYQAIMKLTNNIIETISGNLSGSGVKFNQFLKLFCLECKYFEKEEIINAKDKFDLKASTSYDQNDKIFKINELELTQNNQNITANIFYDLEQKKTKMQINIDQINLLERLDLKINNQFDFLQDYFNLINGFDFDLELSIKKLQFADYFITNFSGNLSSLNGIMTIKQIQGKFLDQDNLKIIGEIFNNKIRDEVKLKVKIPLQKDKNDLIYFELMSIKGGIYLNNLQVIIKDKLEIAGNLEIRNNLENTDIYGQIDFNNSDLENLKEYIKNLIEINEISKSENGGKFLNNLLVLTRRLKLNSNLNLSFNNSKLGSTNIEKMLFTIQIDDNGIMIDSDLLDPNIFNIHSESNLFWNALKPNVSLNIQASMINFSALNKLLNLNDIKFILNPTEFKAINNQNLWPKLNINLKPFVGFDLQSRIILSNIFFENLKLDNLVSIITSNNNELKIHNLNVAIDKAKIDINGMIKLIEQSASLIFSVNSMKLNFFGQNDNSYLSASGKINTKGFDLAEIIKKSNGIINYLFYNIRIDNLNLDLFIEKFGSINNENQLITLAENSVISGNSILNSMQGTANIKGGTVKTNLEFFANKFNGAGSFNIITENSALSGLTRFAFINREKKNSVIVDLEWGGNIYNINKNFNLEKLQDLLPK